MYTQAAVYILHEIYSIFFIPMHSHISFSTPASSRGRRLVPQLDGETVMVISIRDSHIATDPLKLIFSSDFSSTVVPSPCQATGRAHVERIMTVNLPLLNIKTSAAWSRNEMNGQTPKSLASSNGSFLLGSAHDENLGVLGVVMKSQAQRWINPLYWDLWGALGFRNLQSPVSKHIPYVLNDN